ncbi:AFG3 family protein [Fistulifera solaris]|uniref:AFG3 family protein n=1 Tax=Fistulifera solaris TaxID=1519565 RepID=A0A1Z5KMJ8_FISSO|nr:AFG3 family protein [Fistulifera solaris]|eukprot:GAX27560.1 AFG3 family protein [Fistulifera solaris]
MPSSSTRFLSLTRTAVRRIAFNHNRILSSRTLASSNLSSSSWWMQKPSPGSGFDSFLGKEKNEKQQQHNQQQNDNNNNNNDYGNLPRWLLFMAAVAYYEYRQSQNTGNKSASADTSTSDLLAHREITWHELWQLLQQKDVVKIIVTDDNQTARIYVRPQTTLQRRNVPKEEHHEQDDEASLFYQPPDEESSLKLPDLSTTTTTTTPAAPFYYRMQIGSVDVFERKVEEAQKAMASSQLVPIQYTSEDTIGRALLGAIPGLLMVGVLYGMIMLVGQGAARGSTGGPGGMGSIFQIGKSTAKKIKAQDVKVTFADVAGCDQAKLEIMEFVDFLKDAAPFTRLGAKIPKGALLCGPPGTGKTLLAKAVAGESGVPFFSISGSDFIEMFVGVGPSRVRDLFAEARANAPCIVFIDEIDAVGRQRGRGGMGGNDERENTLNQLLVEMDGFEASTGVVVLAGTNRVDILDQALTRPGRFDRQIIVDKPDLNGRKEIFKVHLKGIQLHDDVDDIAGRLAGLTPGFAGADIANICNEAAIVAARRKGDTVTLDDFEKATDRIIGGLESNKIMSKEEREIVAHHEAGHAVAGWFLEHADPLMKVTIIPRSSGALGYAQYLPKEVALRTQPQIMDIVCMALAGRAAEDIFFGRVTTGASDDLKRVTDLVYSTIQLYGMNPRLGQLSFPRDPNAMLEDRPYSEKTARAMDEEARRIVDEAYSKTVQLLTEKKTQVEQVANMLLEKETITHDDIVQLIGKRPFAGDPAYEEFLARRKQVLHPNENEAGEIVGDTLEPGLA